VPALRDITPAELDGALDRLDDPVLLRRVRHVVTENARVVAAAQVLRATKTDVGAIGSLLSASHRSLRDDFEVSSDRLDLAVAAALDAGALGARLTGAGFGGCAIALTPSEAADGVIAEVGTAFSRRRFAPPTCFTAEPSAGAQRVG
jgi:galactokinase